MPMAWDMEWVVHGDGVGGAMADRNCLGCATATVPPALREIGGIDNSGASESKNGRADVGGARGGACDYNSSPAAASVVRPRVTVLGACTALQVRHGAWGSLLASTRMARTDRPSSIALSTYPLSLHLTVASCSNEALAGSLEEGAHRGPNKFPSKGQMDASVGFSFDEMLSETDCPPQVGNERWEMSGGK